MKINSIINNKENPVFIQNYYFSDIILRIFSFFWLFYIIYIYEEIKNRPSSLYEPIVWIQKIVSPTLPSSFLFYLIIIITISLCIITIVSSNYIYRVLLFILILWLNSLKWHFNSFSHVGHLFVLSHFFTMLLPRKKLTDFTSKIEIKNFSNSIRWAYAGVLVTYTMAGLWKFISLAYKLILKPNEVNWLNENAVELNAFASTQSWDETVSSSMLYLYGLPYIWEIGTLLIFFFQLIAILGAFNKKISLWVMISLVAFHTYNILFINTYFYIAIFVIIILLFPYHYFQKQNETFES